MRSLALVTIAYLAVSPVSAQETEGEPAPEEGLSLIEEGARMFLEGLAEDMAPAMKDLAELAESWQPQMREFVTQMGPALSELLDKVDDISRYHAPEMLPNGDIIMRRKAPAEEGPGEGLLPMKPGEDIEI
ncbi:hypothetical protein [Roseovarius sp. CH_XMU1461]|uniref:hypothetical protein n=1 Tax=Roseovarius sp. CH_XMU1461 TaxID=3107777 RepID=UPI00300B0824